MRESTKRVYKAVEDLQFKYYYPKKRDNARKNGGERQRVAQFLDMATELHKQAETRAAHAKIDKLIRLILADEEKKKGANN